MNAPNASGWRPELGPASSDAGVTTASGDRGLMLEEPLIFELGQAGTCGVDFEDVPGEPMPGLDKFLRAAPPELPGLTEPETGRDRSHSSAG
jgi:glycine dehydrogenase subunit 2